MCEVALVQAPKTMSQMATCAICESFHTNCMLHILLEVGADNKYALLMGARVVKWTTHDPCLVLSEND